MFLPWPTDFKTGCPRTASGFDHGTKSNTSEVGLGLDVSLFTGVNLYVRQQWYSYRDPNFTMNQLSGTETMVELKMTF